MNTSSTSESVNLLIARRRSLCWRIHCWAALIASPFVLLAALTGILYVFTPQIELALYGSLDHVIAAGERRPLDELVAAAVVVAPAGWSVRAVLPGYNADDSVRVTLAAEQVMHNQHEGHVHDAPENSDTARAPANKAKQTTVYINPYNAAVLGQMPDRQRFNAWAKNLHSSLLQGEGWRWMIELAVSWLLVMLLTGIYLWWPRGSQSAWPQPHIKGRAAWRQWHSFAGIVLSVLTLVMLATGITWSKYAGKQVRELRDYVGQAPPQVPRDLASTSSGAAMLSWQAAWDAARIQVPDVSLQLTPPKGATGVWRISSADRAHPTTKFDLVLDAYSGHTLYFAGWDKQTTFSKATAIGIPFHRGELGLWNQLLILLFGLGVLFYLVSGWVMFFKRRRTGLFGLPTLVPGAIKSVPLLIWLLAAALLALLPLLAISVGVLLVIELCLRATKSPAAV
jgi:uncharacterized iron-regulated membrane protein